MILLGKIAQPKNLTVRTTLVLTKSKEVGAVKIPVAQTRIQRPKVVKTVKKEQWDNLDMEDSN